MKKFFTLLLFAAIFAVSCSQQKQAQEYPMFWTWLEDLPDVNMEESFANMAEAGIDAVMLHAASTEDYHKDIKIAKKYGIKVYAWMWTLNPPRQERQQMLEAHPEWFDINRNGESLANYKAYVRSYKFLNPSVPEIKDYLLKRIDELCSIEGIEGICLDYCRLVDVVLPISLSYIYDITQDTEVFPQWDFGYHPAMLGKFIEQYGYDPRNQEDPSRDLKWRQFRCDEVTAIANFMADAIHARGKVVTASPFTTPKIASFMVAQDWGKWNVDIAFPMLYTDFYTMDASFAYDGTIENNRDKNPSSILGAGLDTELGGPAEKIFEKMDYAFKAGAQAVSLYTIAGLETPELRARFKQYSDSLRTLRAANGGKVPYGNCTDKTCSGKACSSSNSSKACSGKTCSSSNSGKACSGKACSSSNSSKACSGKTCSSSNSGKACSGKACSSSNSSKACSGTPCAADTNPFNNKKLMSVVERNIQRMVAGEPIHEHSVNGMVYDDGTKIYPALDLGEYNLVRENERIKIYKVTDNASGKTFDVLFIVYGDIISGWDIRENK